MLISKRNLVIAAAVVAVVLVLFLVYGFFNGVPGGDTEPGTGL